jgi:hypothetical protein
MTVGKELEGKTGAVFLISPPGGQVRGRIVEVDKDFIKVERAAGYTLTEPFETAKGLNRFVTIPVANIRAIHTRE